MKASLFKAPRGRKGSALLIILAFVLLLAIITTAFLSRAILDKTVSVASSDQTRTDIFAAGAIDAILSDCQQEIAAGSTGTTTSGTTIYIPATAQAIVPSRTWQSGTITQPNPLPNLVKRSACGLTFYPTSDTTDYPNASTYPPNEKTFTSADPNDSTATASLNGRSYSSVRWNQALLLPKATLTSSTDYTPTATFTPPDWILVERDGTNPTAWSSTLTIARTGDVTTINKNPVVGRYAYTIYDEGGLLDANVVGFPSVSGASGLTQKYYRTSLASVDLTWLRAPTTTTSLPVLGGTAFFTQNDIDSLVGWRNYATLQASGSVPSYTFTNTMTVTNYFQNVYPPNSGFLHATVPSSVTSITNSQSDRKFASRQQLIDLLLNNVAQSTTEKANLQNSLQYLGTFSRGLNQPSYIPDPGRPRELAGSSTDPSSNGGNIAAADDAANYINVPFPATLVQSPFPRNDGSVANVGEPLVKKRFALNRLAWLTCGGPIADDAGNIPPTTYPDGTGVPSAVQTQIQTTATTLENVYGYSASFLAQGGPSNIKAYFGLQWKADGNDNNREKWYYNLHNGGGSGSGAIQELGNGTMTRDPDFFELLKAAILAGSKGKTFTVTSAANSQTDTSHPYNVQNKADVSLDSQIIQIGANIIDQSRLDGFTTEILFDNGSGFAEYRGVENYPYLYRIRTGSLKLRNEKVSVADTATKTLNAAPLNLPLNQANYSGTFTDTGVAAMVQNPEVWNPHDVNAPLANLPVASYYPAHFRVVVDSASPSVVATGSGTYAQLSVYGQDSTANSPMNNICSWAADPAYPYPMVNNYSIVTSQPFNWGPNGTGAPINGGYNGNPKSLNPQNTALTFVVPTTAGSETFREPTLLSRPNVPSGTSLGFGWNVSGDTDLPNLKNAAGTTCYTGGGFLSDAPNPLGLTSAPATTQPYLGIFLGLYPVQFYAANGTQSAANNYIYVSAQALLASSTNTYLTYRMQYADPILNSSGSASGAWVTYDEKYIQPNTNWDGTPTGTLTGALVQQGPPGNIVWQAGSWQSFADPRTSRFGAPGGDTDVLSCLGAPGTTPYLNSPDWLDPNNGILVSDRPDYNEGFLYEGTRKIQFNSTIAPGWAAGTAGYSYYRWGPLSQNVMTAQGNLRYIGDTGTYSKTGATPVTQQPYYYADPDGVVRRGMGGLVPSTANASFGLPMATATKYSVSGTVTTPSNNANQSPSRPFILKRPFRTVGELGYVFSGTPWKNLDFTNSESGDSGLLDVFCINDTDDPNGLVAGRVNLNTQQIPVLAAILANANYDDAGSLTANFSITAKGAYIGSSYSSNPDPNGNAAYFTSAAFYLANRLVTGPSGTSGTSVTPLTNVRDLVGKWVGGTSAPSRSASTVFDGTSSSYYGGFSTDITSLYDPLGSLAASYNYGYSSRYREAALRALSSVGETRVWNLMIDVVAQTGRFPTTATNASNFIVEGERRYWVHVAIDRFTGKILDRQIEEVRQ